MGALIWGNGSYKSPTTDRSRGRHPRLRPLKRACWSDIIMAGSPRTGRMRRMGPKLPLHATSENAQQLLACGALHSGNTFWKN